MTYIEHVTAEGERWDQLAHRYYGDPLQYQRLVEANPHVAVSPLLPSGLTIRVPLLSPEAAAAYTDESHLPPWKRSGG